MEHTEKHTLDWLVGDWKRTNDDADKSTFEQWKKESLIEYKGTGYTLQKGDTVFKEHLRIIKSNDNWIYEVTGVNESPTLFHFTEQTANSFTCENEENEFPKKIVYAKEGNLLEAKVSGGEIEIEFLFSPSQVGND